MDTQQSFMPPATSTQAVEVQASDNMVRQADSIEFSPKNTSTQHLDRGWRSKMGEERMLGFPSRDFVVDGPHQFREIKNIFTGKMETVLVDPDNHPGYTTKQQEEAIHGNLLRGSGVRISIEGNIGSGTNDRIIGYRLLTANLRKEHVRVVVSPNT